MYKSERDTESVELFVMNYVYSLHFDFWTTNTLYLNFIKPVSYQSPRVVKNFLRTSHHTQQDNFVPIFKCTAASLQTDLGDVPLSKPSCGSFMNVCTGCAYQNISMCLCACVLSVGVEKGRQSPCFVFANKRTSTRVQNCNKCLCN